MREYDCRAMKLMPCLIALVSGAAALSLNSCLLATQAAASAGSAALGEIDPARLFESDAPRKLSRGQVIELSGSEQNEADSGVSAFSQSITFNGNIAQTQNGDQTVRSTYKRCDKQRATLEVLTMRYGRRESSAVYELYFDGAGKGSYTMKRQDASGKTSAAGSGSFTLR